MEYLFIFILGSIFGSFFNVLLLRKNTGESVVSAPSRCFSCGARLGFLDLIPIFSFLFLRGRCRHCGSKISVQYPAVEACIGVLAVIIYSKFSIFNFQFSNNFQFLNSLFLTHNSLFVWYFAVFSSMFLVAAYDFKTKIIDSHFLRIFGAFAVLEFIARNWFAPPALLLFSGGWIGDAVSAFLIAFFFYLMWRFSGGRWMGRGDADLAFFTSLFLGFPINIAGFLFAFWIGGIVGVFLLFYSAKGGSVSGGKKIGLKSEIPFGPFLALGALIAWLVPLENFFNMLFL